MSLSSTYLSVKRLLADNLSTKGVDAHSTDGLTTLSNKVLDIKTSNLFALDRTHSIPDDFNYVQDTSIEKRIFGQYTGEGEGIVDKEPQDIWSNTNDLTIVPVDFGQTQGGSASITNVNTSYLKTPFAYLDDYVLSFDFQCDWGTGTGSGRYHLTFGANARYQIGVDVSIIQVIDENESSRIIEEINNNMLYNKDKHHCVIYRTNNALSVIIDDTCIIGGIDVTNEPNIIGLNKWGNYSSDHFIKIDNVKLFMKRQDRTDSYLLRSDSDYTMITGSGAITPNSVYQQHIINNNTFTSKNTYVLSFVCRFMRSAGGGGFSMGNPDNFWSCIAENDTITIKHNDNILAQNTFNSSAYDLSSSPLVTIVRNENHWSIDFDARTRRITLNFDYDCQNNFGIISLDGGMRLSEFKIINTTFWDEI